MPEVLGLAAAIIPLSIAASVYQSMRIAPVTAAIMLLASPSNVDPVVSAADRVFEIALGSIVGLAVAIFVFPARAHSVLADKAARTVALLAEVLRNTLARFFGNRDDAALTRLHERIRASLAEAETAGVEAWHVQQSKAVRWRDGLRRVALYSLLPLAIIIVNFCYFGVPDAAATTVRFWDLPAEARSAPWWRKPAGQPLDLLLCPGAHWGCRYLSFSMALSWRRPPTLRSKNCGRAPKRSTKRCPRSTAWQPAIEHCGSPISIRACLRDRSRRLRPQ